MIEHLTERQIKSFHRRELSPDGLRAAHQHLATCEVCRARLSTTEQLLSASAAFERELQKTDVEDEHLRYEQISGYVDNELGEIDRELVESHLEACAECATEVNDLRSFKSIITAEENESVEMLPRREQSLAGRNRRSLWKPVYVAVAAAVGIILILTAAIFLLRTRASRHDQTQQAQTPQTPSGDAQQNLPSVPSPPAPPQITKEEEKPSDDERVRPPTQPEKKSEDSQGTTSPRPSSQIIVALKDGDRVVSLDSRGQISGVAGGAPGVQRLVAAALLSERLEKPPALDRLIRAPSTQLDGPGESSSLALERPVGTVVESERPTFIWKPLTGASGYVVNVFDAQLNEVARSQTLHATEWRPPRALQRGSIYRWQVVAIKDGREVVLPSPTAPEAKFQVLDEQQEQALARARKIHARSHLALSVLYAQRGLLDEAERELQALVKDNPTSVVAKKLLESLQAWRSAQRKPPEDGEDPPRP